MTGPITDPIVEAVDTRYHSFPTAERALSLVPTVLEQLPYEMLVWAP